MSLNRDKLERQLVRRKAAQEAYESSMDVSDPKARRKDTKWRQLDADRRAVATRLFSLKKVEERDAAIAEKKAAAGEAA